MNSKGYGQIVAIILIVSVTILTALYLETFDFGNIEKPVFAIFEIEKITKGRGFESQVVILRHVAGENLDVRKMSLNVVIYRGGVPVKSCILQNFPWKHETTLPPNAVVGDEIIDRCPIHYAKYLGELSYKSDGMLSPGETIGFRIKKYDDDSNAGMTLRDGDIVEVTVIYGGHSIYTSSKIFR